MFLVKSFVTHFLCLMLMRKKTQCPPLSFNGFFTYIWDVIPVNHTFNNHGSLSIAWNYISLSDGDNFGRYVYLEENKKPLSLVGIPKRVRELPLSLLICIALLS